MNETIETQKIFNLTHTSGDNSVYFLSLYLSLFILWMLYLIFFNARLVGSIISFFAKKIFKKCYIKIGSISICFLGGKIMIKDLNYCDEDISVKCCYLFIIFNYWTAYDGNKNIPGRRSLKLGLYGLDVHLFNRIGVYQKLKDLKKNIEASVPIENTNSYSNQFLKLIPKFLKEKHHNFEKIADPPEETKTQRFIFKCMELFPCVKIIVERAKICAGNHLLPNAIILNVDKINGTYSINNPRCSLDKYQNFFQGVYNNINISLVPTIKYSGHYLNESPLPKCEKAFNLISLDRGKILYYQDEPGLIQKKESNGRIIESELNSAKSYAQWELRLFDTHSPAKLKYGPWADRQREILWNFFFPSNYEEAEVTDVTTPNLTRPFEELKMDFIFQKGFVFDLVWLKKDELRSLNMSADQECNIQLMIPFITRKNGFTTRLLLDLNKPTLSLVSHVWAELIKGGRIKLDLAMEYNLNWNSEVVWNFVFSSHDTRLTFLFDHKNFFKSLVEDWNKFAKSDLASFIPYTYKFQFKVQNLELAIVINENNWVSSTPENSIFSVCIGKFLLVFDLPYTDFLPEKVPINLKFNVQKARARMSIPVTSTCLYSILDLNSHLRIVNQSGYKQKTKKFKVTSEKIVYQGKTYQRHWFDVWISPSASLNIIYIYHPMHPLPDYNDSLWHLYPKYIQRLNKQGDNKTKIKEEDALKNLRPDSQKNNGPTHNMLLENEYDPCYLEADTVDVNFQLPSGTAVLYGPFIKALIIAKENYLGTCQNPVDMDQSPLGMFEDPIAKSLSKVDKSNSSHLLNDENDCIIDPRTYRPYCAKITVNIHNIQAHLPYHSNSGEAPCPTLFLDCLGFEMDKRFHGTKLQVLLSPILLCIYDKVKTRTEKSLSIGRGQILGLQFRGEAMFSQLGIPLSCDTLEYGWLMELIVGDLSGQYTCSQLAILSQCLNVLINTTTDQENELIPSKSYSLCQHNVPQGLCPLWGRQDSPCPGEEKLKYVFLRLTIDSISLALIEHGTCFKIELKNLCLCRCNGHGNISKDGVIFVTSKVEILQLIRKLDQTEMIKDKSHWIEAGKIFFGPIQVIATIAPEDIITNQLQKSFLLRHDKKFKRLWFLWRTEKCGCFGGCQFFGDNKNGKSIANEIISKKFIKKTIFRPLIKDDKGPILQSYAFGESIIKPRKFIYELHNSMICLQNSNGFQSMTETVVNQYDYLLNNRNKKILEEMSLNNGYIRDEKTMKGFECLCESCQPSSDIEVDYNSSIESDNFESDNRSVLSSEYSSSMEISSISSLTSNEIRSCHSGSSGERQHLLSNIDGSSEIHSLPARDLDKLIAKKSKSKNSKKFTEKFGIRIKKKSHEKKANVCILENFERVSADEKTFGDDEMEPCLKTKQSPPTPPPRAFIRPKIDAEISELAPFMVKILSSNSEDEDPDHIADEELNNKPADEETEEKSNFFVELKNQLNKPIMNSALLRNAYERHLSKYHCIQNWNEPLSYKKRWHICQSILLACGDESSDQNNLDQCQCPCRPIGRAAPPVFLTAKQGFTPGCLLTRPMFANIPMESEDANDEVDFEHSEASSNYNLYAAGIDSSSKSMTSIIVEETVEVLISPLFVESFERYISPLINLTKNLHTSAVIDLVHYKCRSIAKNRYENTPPDTDLYIDSSISHDVVQESNTEKAINKLKVPNTLKTNFKSPIPKTGNLSPSLSRNSEILSKINRRYSKMFSNSDAACPEKGFNPEIAIEMDEKLEKTPPEYTTFSSDTTGITQKLTKVAAFNVKQINVCFLQIYTVENVVELETLKSGLYDVTCVSLMTFAIDSVNAEILMEKDVQYYSFPMSNTSRVRNSSKHKHVNSEFKEISQLSDDFNDKLPFIADHSQRVIPNKFFRNKSGHIRQPSAPPNLFILSEESEFPDLSPNNDLNSDNERPPEVRSLNIESTRDVEEILNKVSPNSERTIGNLSISRIHGQLRRLTKDSLFNSKILLNAIPFHRSKVFFTFPSDPNQSQVLKENDKPNKMPKEKLSRPSTLNCHQWPNSRVPLPQSCVDLESKTSGWIMFECGCEQISLTGIQKKGYQTLTLTADDKKEQSEAAAAATDDDASRNVMVTESTQTPSSDTNLTHGSLKVGLIWFNFPAPKRLPSKRKVELIRNDWNFLSTFSPMVNAWINPIDRTLNTIKQIRDNFERRVLSVTICLMTQSSTPGIILDGFDRRQRISCIEEEIGSKLMKKRTNLGVHLRYDASCQIFTAIRRYLLAYQDKSSEEIKRNLAFWLKPSFVPQTDFLRRCALALTCEMKLLADDISMLHADTKKTPGTSSLSQNLRKSLMSGNTLSKPLSSRFIDIFTTTKHDVNVEKDESEDDKTDAVDSTLKDKVDVEAANMNDKTDKEFEPTPLDYETAFIQQRELEKLDSHEKKIFESNPVLQKFLFDSWMFSNKKMVRKEQNILNGEQDLESSLKNEPINMNENTISQEGKSKASERKINFTKDVMNKNVVEDRFWPLLEVVGLNTKGVRKTTLMRKFDGLFSAEGLLEAFQIEIIKSIENPLKLREKAKEGSPENAQMAFLCQNFKTRLTLRDVDNSHERNNKVSQNSKKFDIRQTTTHINILFNIECIRNHLNMSLLRLIHQFSTTTYTARDTRMISRNNENTQKNSKDSYGFGMSQPGQKTTSKIYGHKKNSSYDSSDGTNHSTINSHKSQQLQDNWHGDIYAGVHYNRLDESDNYIEMLTNQSNSSHPSSGKGKEADNLEYNPQTGFAKYKNKKEVQDEIPSCWQRLYQYLEIYNTVPQPRQIKSDGNLKRSSQNINKKDNIDYINECNKNKSPQDIPGIHIPKFEHVPYLLFVTAEIHETIITAVLSELKLQANVGNILASVYVGKRVQNFASFQSKSIESSMTGHFGGCKIRLVEGIRPNCLEVASVQVEKSNCIFSSKPGKNLISENASFVNIGKVKISLPHHPMQLHGVVQRQAKRITNTMSEFLRTPTQSYTSTPSEPLLMRGFGPSQTDGLHNQPTPNDNEKECLMFGSSNNSYVEDNNTIISSMKNRNFDVSKLSSFSLTNNSRTSQSSFAFNLTAIAQGFTIKVALHPSLNANYQTKPIYFLGRINQFINIDFVLKDHSLILQSSLDSPKAASFSRTVCLKMPKILVSLNQRKSSGGVYSKKNLPEKNHEMFLLRNPKVNNSKRMYPSKSNLIRDLTSEEGIYYDIQASIGHIDQTLTTDMLNYILVVAKLFFREINEVIQKMSGEELMDKTFIRSISKRSTEGGTTTNAKVDSANNNKVRFSARIQFKGIRLLATTNNGTLKMETSEISVDVSNRVFKTKNSINDDSLFIYCIMEKFSAEMGQMIYDPDFKEMTPDFSSLAFIKTSIELRSLFAEEISKGPDHTTTSGKFDDESFLISLNRPLVCLKPSAIDRALLLWFVYKSELIKWNEHINLLSTTATSYPMANQKQAPIKETYPAPSAMSPQNRVFVQLNIRDFGFSLPMNILQIPETCSIDFDSRNALVLTMNQSRLSGCFAEQFVCHGEFTDFCLRFHDEFNIGSDDWAPEMKNFTFYNGKVQEVMILNAITVPKGTFQVYWKAPDTFQRNLKTPWILTPQLNITGVNIHLDTEFGNRLKWLFSTFTNMTGCYDDFMNDSSNEINNDILMSEKKNYSRDELNMTKRSQQAENLTANFDDIQYELDDEDGNLSDYEVDRSLTNDDLEAGLDENAAGCELTFEPSLMVQVKIKIDIDSAKCVLHPKLRDAKKSVNNPIISTQNIFYPQNTNSSLFLPDKKKSSAANIQPEGVTSEERLNAYFLRYKKSFCEYPLQKLSDITFFYLPAVDITVNYASKTEMDLTSRRVGTGDQFGSDSSQVDNSGTNQSYMQQKVNKIRKRADIYAFCSLRNLTEELIIHPALLDFLEQMANNIPTEPTASEMDASSIVISQQTPTDSSLVDKNQESDCETERMPQKPYQGEGLEMAAEAQRFRNEDKQSMTEKSLHSDASQNKNEDESNNRSNNFLSTRDQFPVDVIFHFETEPTKIRLLCLPESQMQCLLTIPSMSLVFSSKRKSDDAFDENRCAFDDENHSLEQGLCITVLLKEFSLSVFYPSTTRNESNDDSLTVNIKDIALNLSRVTNTKFIQKNAAVPKDRNETFMYFDEEKNLSTLYNTQTSVQTPRPNIDLRTIASSASLSKLIHQTINITVSCSIGLAEFKCDTRRTLDIFDMINAWYRSSLARHLFLGNKTDPKATSPDVESDLTTPLEVVSICETSKTKNPSSEFKAEIGSKGEFVPDATHRNSAASRKASFSGQFNEWFEKSSNQKQIRKISKSLMPNTTNAKKNDLDQKKSATVHKENIHEEAWNKDDSSDQMPDNLPSCLSEAIPIFLVNIKKVNVQLYIGSALGFTNLAIENLFCHGRLSYTSTKRKTQIASIGFQSCAFTSEQGTVGGEFNITDFESKIKIKEDPGSDPENMFNAILGGLESRLDYMNTSIIFLRVSKVQTHLNDFWKFIKSPTMNTDLNISNIDASTDPMNNVISVQGYCNWDKLQVGISRTTTPDLLRSVKAVQEYFEKQFNEGRTSLLFGSKLRSNLPSSKRHSSTELIDTSSKENGILALFKRSKEEDERMKLKEKLVQEMGAIDKIYERHWQNPMNKARNVFDTYKRFKNTDPQHDSNASKLETNTVPPVLSGSLQLTGNLISIACFAGTFRSAPDWAVFCIQHVTACFETESQRDIGELNAEKSHHDPDGWLNIRQVLSFDLGAQPHYCPQTAYVLRVKKGSGELLRQTSAYSISNWIEYMFNGADESIMNNLRNNHPKFLQDFVKMSEFGVEFADLLASRKATETTAGPSILKAPKEVEFLFILPSISVRIVSDQEQPMNVDLYQKKEETADPSSAKPYTPVVGISFQSDFHGVIQLGLIDMPWLPSLISSYLTEHKRDILIQTQSQHRNLIENKDEAQITLYNDGRSFSVIHWNLSPECRFLLASNTGAPAFDIFLEKIGFSKARVTIPKWIQRGLMDNLDQLLANLVKKSLKQ